MKNPSLATVDVDDTFISDVQFMSDRSWAYRSTVLGVEKLTLRFGKPDRILQVRVDATDADGTNPRLVEHKSAWWSVLSKGLV